MKGVMDITKEYDQTSEEEFAKLIEKRYLKSIEPRQNITCDCCLQYLKRLKFDSYMIVLFAFLMSNEDIKKYPNFTTRSFMLESKKVKCSDCSHLHTKNSVMRSNY